MNAALCFILVLLVPGALVLMADEIQHIPTTCKVDIVKQLDSCTDSSGNTFEGGSIVEVNTGTICVHEVCRVLRRVECVSGGRWVGQGGRPVTEDAQHQCNNEELTNNHGEPILRRVERGFRIRTQIRPLRRSPPPPPPPIAQCGQPGTVSATIIHVTATSQGGVVTYTCIQHYIHTSGDLTRTCQSNSQWSGTAPTCAYMNTCESGPCVNGGTCTNIPDSYTCLCPPIWNGIRCEIDGR